MRISPERVKSDKIREHLIVLNIHRVLSKWLPFMIIFILEKKKIDAQSYVLDSYVNTLKIHMPRHSLLGLGPSHPCLASDAPLGFPPYQFFRGLKRQCSGVKDIS